MDFNRLKTFLVVAETGNMTQAANLLYRTQPAITQQMKLFQEELKLVLFEKRKARIFLTAQGQALYDFAKPHVRELEDFPLRMRDDDQNVPGKLRLGTIPVLGPLITPDLCAGFQRKFPKIQVEITFCRPGDMAEALIANRFDFGLALYEKNHSQLDEFQFEVGACMPVASPRYLAQKPESPQLDDLMNLNIIELNCAVPDWLPWLEIHASDLLDQWSSVIPSVVVEDLLCHQEMLIRGMGIGMGYLPLITPQLETGTLQSLFPKTPPVPIEAYLLRRKTRNPNWAHDLFDTYVRNSIK